MKLRGVTIPTPDLNLLKLKVNSVAVFAVLLLATVYWHMPSNCLGDLCFPSDSHLNYAHDGMTNSESDGCHVCKMFEMMFKSRHFMTTVLSAIIDAFV